MSKQLSERNGDTNIHEQEAPVLPLSPLPLFIQNYNSETMNNHDGFPYSESEGSLLVQNSRVYSPLIQLFDEKDISNIKYNASSTSTQSMLFFLNLSNPFAL